MKVAAVAMFILALAGVVFVMGEFVTSAIDPMMVICRGLTVSRASASGAKLLVSADPKPDLETTIHENQISMTFNQKVADHSVVVTDSEGCVVSQSDEVTGDDNTIVVHMKACKRMGYPGGNMSVRYNLNGVSGEYHLHIMHHH